MFYQIYCIVILNAKREVFKKQYNFGFGPKQVLGLTGRSLKGQKALSGVYCFLNIQYLIGIVFVWGFKR